MVLMLILDRFAVFRGGAWVADVVERAALGLQSELVPASAACILL